MKLIELSQGMFAKIDDEDFDKVIKLNWSVAKRSNNYYAVSGSNYYGGNQINLHRFVLDLSDGDKHYVDHKDHDGLNCQKSNLRLCTNQQNQYNSRKIKNTSSIYKGVRKRKDCERFEASIRINKKKVYLGNYKEEKSAAEAYNKMAIIHFGEFANLNKL